MAPSPNSRAGRGSGNSLGGAAEILAGEPQVTFGRRTDTAAPEISTHVHVVVCSSDCLCFVCEHVSTFFCFSLRSSVDVHSGILHDERPVEQFMRAPSCPENASDRELSVDQLRKEEFFRDPEPHFHGRMCDTSSNLRSCSLLLAVEATDNRSSILPTQVFRSRQNKNLPVVVTSEHSPKWTQAPGFLSLVLISS